MAAATSQLALPSGERDADSSVGTYGVLVLGLAALVGIVAMVGAWLTLRYDSKVWPAKGFVIQDYYGNVLAITIILAAGAAWWALFGVVKGERRQSAMALGLVIFLEGAFINLITYVLRSSTLSPTKSAFPGRRPACNTHDHGRGPFKNFSPRRCRGGVLDGCFRRASRSTSAARKCSGSRSLLVRSNCAMTGIPYRN